MWGNSDLAFGDGTDDDDDETTSPRKPHKSSASRATPLKEPPTGKRRSCQIELNSPTTSRSSKAQNQLFAHEVQQLVKQEMRMIRQMHIDITEKLSRLADAQKADKLSLAMLASIDEKAR